MRLITAKQASAILAVALPRVYELARRREIPSVRLGPNQIRFDEEALIAWAKGGGIVETDGNGRPKGNEARDAG